MIRAPIIRITSQLSLASLTCSVFFFPLTSLAQKNEPLPDPIGALAKEVEVGRADYRRRFEKIQGDEAKEKQLMDAEGERVRAIARKALALAERHPGTPLALAARTWVVNGRIGSYPETVQALRLLTEKHIADAGLGPAVEFGRAYTLPEAERLLREAWAKSPHRDIRATAGYGLALKLYWQSRGQEAKGQVEEAQRRSAEAEQLLEELVTKYADVKSYQSTVGADAKALLFRMRNLVVGKSAPDFRCTDVSGHEVKLSDLKGRVVVLDFWYVACGPCRDQFPHLRQLVARHADKAFTLVGITGDEDRKTWETFLKKEQLPWTQWYSGPRGVVADWSIVIFPTYFVIDPKGVIRFVNPRGEALDKAVASLLTGATEKKPQ